MSRLHRQLATMGSEFELENYIHHVAYVICVKHVVINVAYPRYVIQQTR